jgi:hypothetical protein
MANSKPPSNTKGATTTDNRPADCRTQRATITPATNKNTPAIKTNVEPPVSGKSHTSTAIMIYVLTNMKRQYNE